MTNSGASACRSSTSSANATSTVRSREGVSRVNAVAPAIEGELIPEAGHEAIVLQADFVSERVLSSSTRSGLTPPHASTSQDSAQIGYAFPRRGQARHLVGQAQGRTSGTATHPGANTRSRRRKHDRGQNQRSIDTPTAAGT